MDVRTLRYFMLVAEEGSISAGARRAMVAQPAVSVAVKKLEREAGAPLLERSYGGVVLTARGRILLTQARRVLRCVEEAQRQVRGGGSGAFTIGLTAGRASAGELTGPILEAFRVAHPDLSVRVRELDFAEQFDEVLDGGVDVALVRSPYHHDDLVMEPLFSEPSVLVASPDHPLAHETEVPVEALGRERLLEVVRAPKAWRQFWNFAELRDERAGIPTHEVGLIGYCLDIVKNTTVSPMAQSGWRFGGLGSPTVRAVKLSDAPHSVIGIGRRADEHRDEVRAFTELARAVTAGMITMVPGAVPVPARPPVAPRP
jgi:DNA-binding transcriptional LysR family regulator